MRLKLGLLDAEVNPFYRQALLDALKYADVHDGLTTDELADRVGRAYAARTLDELDSVLPPAES